MKLDIKTLITLLALSATVGGFFYTTQDRLLHLEEDVAELQKQIKKVKRGRR